MPHLRKPSAILSLITTSALVISQLNVSIVGLVNAQQTPPSAPTPPTAPTAAPAPTSPPAPTAPVPPTYGDPTPTPTPKPLIPTSTPAPTVAATPIPSTEPTSAPAPTTEPGQPQPTTAPASNPSVTPIPSPTSTTSSGGNSQSGQTGDTTIDTGDSNTVASATTAGNNNTASQGISQPSSGTSIINDGNGSGSSNTGSASSSNTTTTSQNNSVNIVNNIDASSVTGDNKAIKNVGDSHIATGDANVVGTIVNQVNTNVAGLMISEFNVADDHVGDIILDPFTSCVSGCGATGSATVANTNNGANSDNDTAVSYVNNEAIFQNNDAVVDNQMTLVANSGDNNASMNTGGDSTIHTGDANIVASALNFVNNNIIGNVYYTTVNIFGNLVGDILLPQSVIDQILAENSNNGANSDNDASITYQNDETVFQSNVADINNAIVINANTGDNNADKNTNGDSLIDTGEVYADVNVVNIANNNSYDGVWWLVFVNEAGNWIGRLVGSPDGSTMAGSEGTEFVVNDNGEVVVRNAGNGTGSTNSSSVDQANTSTTHQTNNAVINNTMNLTANTGDNTTSRNTGGSNEIITGDANVIANIVNFVNNNFVGSGNLLVSMVNVFGSWIGDFVGPNATKNLPTNTATTQPQTETAGIGGSNNSANQQSAIQSSSTNNVSYPEDYEAYSEETEPQIRYITRYYYEADDTQGYYPASASNSNQGSRADNGYGSATEAEEIVLGSRDINEFISASAEATKPTVSINLAWLILLLPLSLTGFAIKRRFA